MTDSPRQRLHDAIQSTHETEEDLEGGVLIGWTVVAEWMDGEGKRWLSGLSGSNGGEDDPPIWQTQGYLYNALHEGFPGDAEED